MPDGAGRGSTGGGLKVIRAVLLAKGLRRNVHHTLHPNSVRIVHLNGAPVGMDVLHGVGSYLAAYCLVALASFLVVSLDGFSVETNLSAMLSCFNNIGPALDAAGPMSNFGAFSNLSKLVLTADMLLGRLEIFPILALFSRRTWRMRRPLRAAH
ncbi:MAG: potassium transporter TrkG [Ruthenibacterium sp.]